MGNIPEEVLLALAVKNSGGGSGTSDYDQLSNKPQIGGVTLSGNKSASDLSLASLDSNGKVPAAQLPSYVDDVINGYLHDGKFYEDDQYTMEISGEDGKIYVDLATNKTYRWSGLAFVEISESLALGETASTAYAGDKGKANADAITAIKDGQSIDSFGDVETALAGKQASLSAGDYIDISGNEISVIREPNGDIVTYVIEQTGYGTGVNITKKLGSEVLDTWFCDYGGAVVTVDDAFTIGGAVIERFCYTITLLRASTTHPAGYVMKPSATPPFEMTEEFEVDMSQYKLVIKSEMDTAIAGKQNAFSVGDDLVLSNNTLGVQVSVPSVVDDYAFSVDNDNYFHITKTHEGTQTTNSYPSGLYTTYNIDDLFTLTYNGNWVITLLVASTEYSAGTTWSSAYREPPAISNLDFVVSYATGSASEFIGELQNDKQDKLTFDSVPTDGSTNPVESNGIYDALASKADASALASKADITDLAPAFSTSTAYTVGQYVSYDGNIYKCTTSHSAGAWVAGDFTLVAVASELETKQPKTDNNLTTTSKDTTGAINEVNSILTSCNNYKRRSRRDISSDLTNLATAISEQDLEKYGYSIGDYFVSTGFTGSTGYTYVLADMDTFYGGYNNNVVVSTHHISLVVKTGANSKWAETNDTSGGYKNSTLHTYLSTTVLDNIKADMIHFFGGTTGLEHLVSHKLLWTTATSGSWEWSDNAEYISALSEPQVYGTNVWAIDGYQTGEAWKWLEVFHKFSFNQILGNIWWWLRSIYSASSACYAGSGGAASEGSASNSGGAVGLILFH